ncbi:MAG TPA: single-stranded DNA-binding protein [Anaerolineae bacterium]|nr:single-stranded DNA-binding protein [Anaerolineae bacterium]HNS49922.1 single-stranded DNA-binding protein [Anaerolineae bacterium]
MFHRVTIIGFVGSDPTMRYTPDGTPVTNFSVATRQVVSKERCQECPSGWKESLNGKNWELTTWFRISCWRKLAEAVNEFVAKGSSVFVEGELRGEAVEGSQNPRSVDGAGRRGAGQLRDHGAHSEIPGQARGQRGCADQRAAAGRGG